MWVEMFLVLPGTCLHWDTGNEYYFLTKVFQYRSSTFQNEISLFFDTIRIWNRKGRLECKIDNFYDLSDTQNMIDVIRFYFWSAFSLDLSLLVWYLRKINMHRQWITIFNVKLEKYYYFRLPWKWSKLYFFLYKPEI